MRVYFISEKLNQTMKNVQKVIYNIVKKHSPSSGGDDLSAFKRDCKTSSDSDPAGNAGKLDCN